jgi:carotenoid 1,2-hydratase
LDVGLLAPQCAQQHTGLVYSGGQRAPGAGRTHGSHVGASGGRDADGGPRFDQTVAPGGYLWWYVDALSDDGQHGLTIIAFVGSVFSPYYAWARRQGGGVADPENFCALNVALYGKGGKRWTMTERGRQHTSRSAQQFKMGPSSLHWDGQALTIDIDEINVPWPMRVRGRVTVRPEGLCRFVTPLDHAGRHRWGPIAPCSRIEVDMSSPGLSWRGHAYMDSNEGDEPVENGFKDWDWARAEMANGDTNVVYDVRPLTGLGRVVAQRFSPDGSHVAFDAPPRHALPSSGWRIARSMSSEAGHPPEIISTLEDTPFYVRSLLRTQWQSEPVTAVHESLDIPRLVSWPVRFMLPWRMPRRA